jgi:hypothetical protein
MSKKEIPPQLPSIPSQLKSGLNQELVTRSGRAGAMKGEEKSEVKIRCHWLASALSECNLQVEVRLD